MGERDSAISDRRLELKIASNRTRIILHNFKIKRVQQADLHMTGFKDQFMIGQRSVHKSGKGIMLMVMSNIYDFLENL